MFHLIDLIWLGAFGLSSSQYLLSDRRMLMIFRVISTALFIIYMMAIGANAGMVACSIALIGTLIQAACPDRYLAKTLKLRIGFAIALCVAAVFSMARSSSDLLPLLAVINARMVEVQASLQRIRMGLFLSQLCWLGYNTINGHTLLFCGDLIGITINLTAIYQFEMRRRRALPVRISS